ncbi:hypothetical protein, partial [Corynebacterium glutamicum]|uniref:hypothetical protein n=1 Tax=Corynebacterium glutamicum TaxID=1718 RepID=UPI001C4E1B2D
PPQLQRVEVVVTKIINGTLLSSQTTYAHHKIINILFVGVLLAACSTLLHLVYFHQIGVC